MGTYSVLNVKSIAHKRHSMALHLNPKSGILCSDICCYNYIEKLNINAPVRYLSSIEALLYICFEYLSIKNINGNINVMF